jgi:hypothetical protein
MFTLVQGRDGFQQVIGRDLPKGEILFVAGMCNHLDKINIVFPVPWEAEVVVHGFNYKRMRRVVISLYKMRVQFADLSASYT